MTRPKNEDLLARAIAYVQADSEHVKAEEEERRTLDVCHELEKPLRQLMEEASIKALLDREHNAVVIRDVGRYCLRVYRGVIE